jgi:hypothetical protein
MNNTVVVDDNPTVLFGTSNKANMQVATKSNNLNIVLSETAKQQASQIANSMPFVSMDEKQVVLFGQHLQKGLSEKMDVMLQEITKGNSPILFELFRQLKKGINTANIGEIEAEIRKSINKGFLTNMLESVGLSSVAGRMQKANVKINELITKKASTLRELIGEMESSIQNEANKLIESTSRLHQLGDSYRGSVEEIGIYVEAGRAIYNDGLIEYNKQLEVAKNSQDPVQAEACKRFKQKLDMFQARVLVLETAYTKSPVEMEYIRLGEGASLTTLGETANTVLEEFNDIKSTLIKVSVIHQIQTVQIMNQERRELRKALQNHSNDLLEDVSVNAEKSKGIHRLEDAEQLLDIAKRIDTIYTKVEEENKNNQLRFAEARTKLVEAKAIVTKL